MNITQPLPCLASALNEHQVHIAMIQQQAHGFTAGISSTTNDPRFDFFVHVMLH